MTRSKRRRWTALAAWATIQPAIAPAATQTAAVSANIVKPLSLTRVQDLDLGTIVLGAGSWSGATVRLARTGVLTCTNPNVICTGATRVAQYKITGTNKQTVTISTPNVTLVKQGDATKTLTMVVDSPGQVMLTSSGQPGITISLGGTITLASTTISGDYQGTFNVTVDYQ